MYGFSYSTDEDCKNEFESADEYFRANPEQTKLPIDYIGELIHPITHSYLKQDDGKILAVSHLTNDTGADAGGHIGEGSYGHVKYAMDRTGTLYALKVEVVNRNSAHALNKTIHEAMIAADLGLLENMPIKTQDSQAGPDCDRYYTTFFYLGDSLRNILKNQTIKFNTKLKIARKILLELHKLHSGLLSKTGKKYAHGDLKPANIVIDEYGNLTLIDYGYAQELTPDNNYTKIRGSALYLPIEDLKNHKDNKQREKTLTYLQALGLAGADLYALKRTLYAKSRGSAKSLFSTKEYNRLPSELKEMLDTVDVPTAVDKTKQHSPLMLAIQFIAFEFNLDIHFLEQLSEQYQTEVYESIALLEALPRKTIDS